MSSSLSWLDHDAAARERSLRLLALFREKESRDELGVGGIRDAIADQLFPGTSTIQTRLRYVFFIPWVYETLEERRVPASQFAAKAREAEVALVKALVEQDDWGVFGRDAGSGLKRLPSSVYWAGLGSWGLRRFAGGQQDYCQQIDRVYGVRQLRSRRDDHDWDGDYGGETWHPRVKDLKPLNFPQEANFVLTRDEAEFLVDRWRVQHPDSLLTWLALDLSRGQAWSEADFPWLHTRLPEFPKEIRLLLEHGRLFSILVRGAALLYNLQLSERGEREEGADRYRRELRGWCDAAKTNGLSTWSLETFWPHVLGKAHHVSSATQTFIRDWLGFVRQEGAGVIASVSARRLIEKREQGLKGPRSRFTNRAALTQWGGSSGLTPLSYRWGTAQTFLGDLLSGLRS